MADESLAALAGRGDERAFELLYERYRDPLYRYCRAILRHPEDAEEALQASMLKAYGALSAGPGARSVRPWLFAIAHNECISLIRARPSAEPLPDVPDPAVERLEDRVELRERLRQLRRDLLALPAPQREALVLRELSGLSHREIGQVMGEPAAAVKQLIYEARQTLLEYGAGRDLACGEVRRRLVDADGRVMRARRMTSHLRACEGCRAFVAEEERRRRGLLILFPPMPALLAGRILEGVVGPSGGDAVRPPGPRRLQTQVAGGLAAGAVAASVAVALALSGGGGPGGPPPEVGAAAAASPPAGSAAASADRHRSPTGSATATARAAAAPGVSGPAGGGGSAGSATPAATTATASPPPAPAGLGGAGGGPGGASGGATSGPDAAPGGSGSPPTSTAPAGSGPAAGGATTTGDADAPPASTAAAVAGPTAGSGPVTSARPGPPAATTADAPTQTAPAPGGDASPAGAGEGTTTAPGRADPPPVGEPVDQAPVDTVKTPPADTTPPDQGGTPPEKTTTDDTTTEPPPDRTVPAETVTRDRASGAIPG